MRGFRLRDKRIDLQLGQDAKRLDLRLEFVTQVETVSRPRLKLEY